MPAEITVASYNIHKGVGRDRRRDLGRTAAVIAEIGADILALQEVDTRFGTRKGLLDLDALQRDLDLVAVPLDQTGPAHGWHGNLLLVRKALVQQVHKLILPGFEPRGAMVTDLQINGQALRVVNTHLGLLPSSRSSPSPRDCCSTGAVARAAAVADGRSERMGARCCDVSHALVAGVDPDPAAELSCTLSAAAL